MTKLINRVNEYLAGRDEDILVADSRASLTRHEFSIIFYAYADDLKRMWSDVPKTRRGIAIQMERDADYLAVIFASWVAEGFYLPLNANSPERLINLQIKCSGVSLYIAAPSDIRKIVVGDTQVIRGQTSNADLAYVIFTSGSTGDKKGVAISKAALTSYIEGVEKVFAGKFVSNSLIINGEFTFDISLADIAFALIFKTEICITPQASNLLSLCSMIKERKVESIYAVPSTWELILDLENKIPDFSMLEVKNIFSGGEALTGKLLNQMRRCSPFAVIYNMYGPTEFTINCFYCEIYEDQFPSKKSDVVPIGTAFPNVEVYLKKNSSSENVGELCLAGPQIMEGYVNAKDPVFSKKGVKFYPTGDLVRQDENQTIHFIGRIRDYEKVSGYRINLNSIEHDLELAIVEDSKVMIVEGKLYYIIKLTSKEDQIKIRSSIKKFAAENLEPYERPAKIIFVDAFPLSTSGKLDRKKILSLV